MNLYDEAWSHYDAEHQEADREREYIREEERNTEYYLDAKAEMI